MLYESAQEKGDGGLGVDIFEMTDTVFQCSFDMALDMQQKLSKMI